MGPGDRTYAAAGVSLATADAIVGRLRAAVDGTRTAGVEGAFGAFAGLYAIDEHRLLAASTDHGALGFPEAGRIAPGARADLVTVTLDSPRTAGIEPDGVFFAATAADVREVMIAGRSIVHDGVHRLIERPSALLAREIERLWR